MPPSRLPSLFVSHGSPMMTLENSPTASFLDQLGNALPRPRAVVVASAHFVAGRPTASGHPKPATIHDFGGFPEALYRIQYPAPGSPALVREVEALLAHAGFGAGLDEGIGLDHGTWVPLLRMYPRADVPVSRAIG